MTTNTSQLQHGAVLDEPYVVAAIELDTSLSARNLLRVTLSIHNDIPNYLEVPEVPSISEEDDEEYPCPTRESAASQMQDIKHLLHSIAAGGN